MCDVPEQAVAHPQQRHLPSVAARGSVGQLLRGVVQHIHRPPGPLPAEDEPGHRRQVLEGVDQREPPAGRSAGEAPDGDLGGEGGDLGDVGTKPPGEREAGEAGARGDVSGDRSRIATQDLQWRPGGQR